LGLVHRAASASALGAVRMAKKRMFASHAKATLELGYSPGPVEEALARAVGWFLLETGT